MASVDLLAGEVMRGSASLLNDTARTVYTYAAQVPYINIALQELQEYFELHSIPVTEQVSAVIEVDAGTTEIVFNGVGVPSFPDDFIEPQQVWERARGTGPYIPMSRRDYLPHQLSGVTTSQFGYFMWQHNTMVFPAANADNDIKLDYIRELFPAVTDENSIINVINAKTFLQYRTASLCAEFIERNLTSANSLSAYAVMGLDRATGISVKGKQTIFSRRRPFRASYKKRGMMT